MEQPDLCAQVAPIPRRAEAKLLQGVHGKDDIDVAPHFGVALRRRGGGASRRSIKTMKTYWYR